MLANSRTWDSEFQVGRTDFEFEDALRWRLGSDPEERTGPYRIKQRKWPERCGVPYEVHLAPGPRLLSKP